MQTNSNTLAVLKHENISIHQIALSTLEMGLVPAMQGTDAHVSGGGDILARCAIALCRFGWDERSGTFNWSLVFKNMSRCHLKLSNIDCLMEMEFCTKVDMENT